MKTALLIAFAFFAALMPAAAQTVPDAPPAPAPRTVIVRLQTEAGDIDIAVEVERAPVTAGNFLRYVDQKRLDGTGFYRAVGDRETMRYGFIQGGAQNDPKRILPPIAHEPTTKTGLTHGDGTISMARYAPGSATADFFITLGEMTSMDANPALPGDNAGFAAFGHVVAGMDVVRHILAAPLSPTLGEGVMKGQMLAPQIRILTARRVP
ncbi:peptidylprolyl isomerase [Sphingobium aquiterrae]|uniref:peptidylprolyl isomerase n=1 Tax=Sphingobium aquiterrae TaxID=2038656 RepID=UPI00301772A7